jgi:dihydrofolate reductase
MTAETNMEIVLVVAVARNGVIGAKGTMPWHLPADLKHFKAKTLGKPMIMGRKTFDSIGRPLPGRDTIVVTRQADYGAEGIHVAASLEDALPLAADLAKARGTDEITIVGGGQIYAQAMGLATRIEYTEIDLEPEGDAHFPPLDPAVWSEQSREDHPAEDERPGYRFLTYVRK